MAHHSGSSIEAFSDWMKYTVRSTRLKTLSDDQVAFVFSEPFIHTGYRLQDEPWSYYFKSMFKIHNETFNVWSHLLAAVMVVKTVLGFSDLCVLFQDGYGSGLIVFGLGCFIGMFTSASVHLLHSKSIRWHYLLVLADYAGVTTYTFGSGLLCMYLLSQKDLYTSLEHIYLPTNAAFSMLTFWTFVKAKLATNGNRKIYILCAIVPYCTIITTPVLGRFIECANTDHCSVFSLNHLTVCILLHIASAVTFAAHCPERFAPGWFDLLGHSHSLFHIVSSLTIYMEFVAVRIDISSGVGSHVNANLAGTLLTYAILIIAKIGIVFYYKDNINSIIEKQRLTKKQK